MVKCVLIGDDMTCLDTDATIRIERHIENLINQHQSIAFYYSPTDFFGIFCKLTVESTIRLYHNKTILKFEGKITSKIIEEANFCITCIPRETFCPDIVNQIDKRKAQGLLEEFDTIRSYVEPDWEKVFLL